jgi:hypothetical protein
MITFLLIFTLLYQNCLSIEEYNSQKLVNNINYQVIFGNHNGDPEKQETKDLFDIFSLKKPNNQYHAIKSHKVTTHSQAKKKWTILIYIAGVNDLYKYALRNIEQMIQVGSNSQLNIIIHFDFHIKGKAKETKRFYVEKNNLLQISDLPAHDSGDAKNLISAAEWAFNSYPSDYFGLILWNHGTGSCDPHFMRKIVNPNDFFYYDKSNNKISLDRSKEFLQYIENEDDLSHERGICFDDTTRNYLDNKKLAFALEKIYNLRGQKKIDILLMDACLMAGIEIAYLCAPYANYLASSEEVVLGPGYNYATTLKPLQKENVTPYDFALSIVKIFAQTYAPISNDFTQSVLNLNIMTQFTNEFKILVELLMQLKEIDNKDHMKKILKLAGSKEMVTHFSEPAYIDLIHFLENIATLITQNPKKLVFSKKENELIKEIKTCIQKKLIPILHKIIIANVNGENIPKAYGVYIYFPRYHIDESYRQAQFALATKWLTLLQLLK